MRDVVYVAVTVGFFALAALFVLGCVRIVGPDDASLGHDEQRDGGTDGESAADGVVVAR